MPHPVVFDGGFLLPYPLLANMVVVNIFLLPALLRTWQMAAASPSAKDVSTGLFRGILFTSVLTLLFILIGIFFFRLLFPGTELSLPAMLTRLQGADSALVRYLIFPLFFAGCLAALLSTADSALAPVLQSLYKDFRGSADPGPWRHALVFWHTIILFVLTLALYFLVFRLLGFNLINWLFTIFSFSIVCTPAIVFAVLAPDELLGSPWSRRTALISVWGSLIVAVALSFIGNKHNLVWLVQLNSPLAALFGSACHLVLWWIHRLRTPRRSVS